MPLITKSKNNIWRIWTGPWRIGKDKKRIGFAIGLNIRTDKLPKNTDESQLKEDLVDQIKNLIIKKFE